MKKFLNKIYDKFVITSSAVITALVGMSAMIVAIAGLVPDSKEVYIVALAFIGLAFVYALYMLLSKAQRKARLAISKNNIKLVREYKAEIESDKTIKQAKKEVKAENKANRL
tara:strand:+ start:323 stop:658 length:336 start_codon:yes stop_codon:yes gene_type:complete